jgi:hypothetical protein
MSNDPDDKRPAEDDATTRGFLAASTEHSREGDEGRYGFLLQVAFNDESTYAYGDVVVDQVRTEWREADVRCRRYMLWAATVAVAFVLLGAGHASELTIAGVKADAQGIDLITRFLPALALALAAEALVLVRMTSEYQELYFSLLKRLHPNVLWGSLGFALSPQTMTPWGQDWTVLVGRHGSADTSWWLLVIGMLNAVAAWLAPLGFAVYAYATLFDHFGDGDALLWVSAIIGAVNVARYLARTVDRDRPRET